MYFELLIMNAVIWILDSGIISMESVLLNLYSRICKLAWDSGFL